MSLIEGDKSVAAMKMQTVKQIRDQEQQQVDNLIRKITLQDQLDNSRTNRQNSTMESVLKLHKAMTEEEAFTKLGDKDPKVREAALLRISPTAWAHIKGSEITAARERQVPTEILLLNTIKNEAATLKVPFDQTPTAQAIKSMKPQGGGMSFEDKALLGVLGGPGSIMASQDPNYVLNVLKAVIDARNKTVPTASTHSTTAPTPGGYDPIAADIKKLGLR